MDIFCVSLAYFHPWDFYSGFIQDRNPMGSPISFSDDKTAWPNPGNSEDCSRSIVMR